MRTIGAMKHIGWLLIVSVGVLGSFVTCAQEPAVENEEPAGELQIYERQSSDGTVARRDVRDEHGRITKTTYYGLRREVGSAFQGPFTEEMLEPRAIVLSTYNEQGQVVLEEHYTRRMMLRRVREIEYTEDGQVRRFLWLDDRRVRTSETREVDGKAVTSLMFDANGEGIVSIVGVLPDDVDLVRGWGNAVLGLSCGLATSTTTGAPSDIILYATARNRGTARDEIRSAFRILLVDSKGRIQSYTNAPADEVSSGDEEEAPVYLRINPNEAISVVAGPLARWFFDDVPPGDYKLVVACPDSQGDYSIVSNTIPLTILAEEESE